MLENTLFNYLITVLIEKVWQHLDFYFQFSDLCMACYFVVLQTVVSRMTNVYSPLLPAKSIVVEMSVHSADRVAEGYFENGKSSFTNVP